VACLGVLVALAVRPEADLVEVLELAGRGLALQRLEEVVVDVDVVERVRLVAEVTCVGLSVGLASYLQVQVREGGWAYLEKVQIAS